MSEPLITTPAAFGENGNLLLERELGQGGMGGVYMGRDKMLDRPVAVKVMLREYGADAQFVEKFKKEAQAAARLIHPNIAQVYSYGIADGLPYIAMELVSGGSLDAILQAHRGDTDIARVMKIGQQVALALRCASDLGFVHGDVKPENILLDANGNAKLVDFGLAAMQKNTDEIWGTPYYIAPEKVKKEGVDFRSDMYSLGATLYHVLTGVAPFEGKDAEAVVRARFDAMPRKPSEIRAEIPEAVDRLVMKMLAFRKEDRYPTFEALLHEYSDVLATGLTPPKPKFVPHFTPSGSPAPGGSAPAPAAEGSGEGGSKRFTVKNGGRKQRRAPRANLAQAAKDVAAADSVRDVGVAKRVSVAVTLIVIAVIAVVGGLGTYVYFAHQRAEAERARQLEIGFANAATAIREVRAGAGKFADEFDAYALNASTECRKFSRRLVEALPEVDGRLKPPLSQELIEAIALTNGASAAATQVAAGAAAKNAAAQPAAETLDLEAGTLAAEFKDAVEDMRELWLRAYGCEAAAIRIRVEAEAIIAECGAAEALPKITQEDLAGLQNRSNALVERYNSLRGSDAVSSAQKNIGYIKSRGEKLIKQTVNRLIVKRNTEQRRLEAERRAKEKAEREAAEKAAHEQLIADEIAGAKSLFSRLAEAVDPNPFQLLEWEGPRRQLEYFKRECKTVEGKLAVDDEIRKVDAMCNLHRIFIANVRGYAFRRAQLGKEFTKVKDADAVELRVVKGRDGKQPGKLTWQRLYKDYHANLNELITEFAVGGRQNCHPALNLKDWAEAMCGAALTIRIVCADDASGVKRSEELVREVAEKYPDYRKNLRVMFPDIDLDGAGGEE